MFKLKVMANVGVSCIQMEKQASQKLYVPHLSMLEHKNKENIVGTEGSDSY